jgi:hypothetical protein
MLIAGKLMQPKRGIVALCKLNLVPEHLIRDRRRDKLVHDVALDLCEKYHVA